MRMSVRTGALAGSLAACPGHGGHAPAAPAGRGRPPSRSSSRTGSPPGCRSSSWAPTSGRPKAARSPWPSPSSSPSASPAAPASGALLGASWGRRRLPRRPVPAGLLAGLALFVLAVLVLRPQAVARRRRRPLPPLRPAPPRRYRWLAPAASAGVSRRRRRCARPRRGSPHPAGALSWSASPGAGSPSPARSPCGASSARPRDGPVGVALGMGEAPGSRGTRRGDGRPDRRGDPHARLLRRLQEPARSRRARRRRLAPARQRARRPPHRPHLDEELHALPQREQWQTLICISNSVGGDYAGNALWRGVAVADLLRLTGGGCAARRAGRLPRRGRLLGEPAHGQGDGPDHAGGDGDERRGPAAGARRPGPPARPRAPTASRTSSGSKRSRSWTPPTAGTGSGGAGATRAVIKTTSRIDFPRRGAVAAGRRHGASPGWPTPATGASPASRSARTTARPGVRPARPAARAPLLGLLGGRLDARLPGGSTA